MKKRMHYRIKVNLLQFRNLSEVESVQEKNIGLCTPNNLGLDPGKLVQKFPLYFLSKLIYSSIYLLPSLNSLNGLLINTK